MEKLIRKHENFSKALKTLSNSLECVPLSYEEESSKILRDSRIKRFEYYIDSFWKLSKRYLLICKDVDLNVPKEIIKQLFKAKVATEEETELLLHMITMRNKTSHMYKEEIADQLAIELEDYYNILKIVSDKLKKNIVKNSLIL